jgi:predicted nucleotidyltransferase
MSRLWIVITERQIETYAEDEVRQFRSLKIVRFGSYAYGNPNEESDFDLMVVMPKDPSGVRNMERAMAIRSAIPNSLPLELLVKEANDMSSRLEEGDCFLLGVFSKESVLYEKADR